MKLNNNLKWILKNYWIVLVLFILSTIFFLYQHYTHFSWDFTVYVSNAKYWLGQGNYYELRRPPIMPAIITLLSPWGWLAAEYLFIIFVSILYLCSSIKFADYLKINKELFYLFSLSPYALFYGMINGTELLSLVLFELFLVFFLQKKSYAGLFLGLACLTRYNLYVFIPLLFFNKNIKLILKNFIYFFIVFALWLIHNYYFTGNFFTGIVDNYLINIVFRGKQQVDYQQLLNVTLFLLPPFIAGIIYTIKHWKVRVNRIMGFLAAEKVNLALFLVMALTIYQYYMLPAKNIRFLFTLILPISYFSIVGVEAVKKRSWTIFVFLIIVLLILNIVYIGLKFSMGDTKDKYFDSINLLKDKNLDKCLLESNVWPLLNYLGRTTKSTPRIELVKKSIDDGNFILLYYSSQESKWSRNKTFLHNFPIIYENSNFILIGNKSKCNPIKKFSTIYILERNESIYSLYNRSINTNPCFIMFNKKPIFEKFCNFVNFNGFKLDKNRVSG